MDSSKPQSAKQLKEYLQHQQEPFSLQTYLSERSYMFKNSTSGTRNIHRLHSQKNLKRSVKCDDLCNVRRTLLQAKVILRSLLCKFFIVASGVCYYEFSDTRKKPKYWFYSKKRLAASDDNFAYHDVEDNFLFYEHHGSALLSMFQTFTLPEFRRVEESVGDPMFSTYLRKQFVNLDIGKTGHVTNNKPQMVRTSFCQRRKRILQTRKQLQLHENEGKNLEIKAVSEFEELGNIINEHFCLMEKQYEEAKKITNLLHEESFLSSEEWRNSNTHNWEIQMEIGDAIMDDIVREIIVSLLG